MLICSPVSGRRLPTSHHPASHVPLTVPVHAAHHAHSHDHAVAGPRRRAPRRAARRPGPARRSGRSSGCGRTGGGGRHHPPRDRRRHRPRVPAVDPRRLRPRRSPRRCCSTSTASAPTWRSSRSTRELDQQGGERGYVVITPNGQGDVLRHWSLAPVGRGQSRRRVRAGDAAHHEPRAVHRPEAHLLDRHLERRDVLDRCSRPRCRDAWPRSRRCPGSTPPTGVRRGDATR